jgi:hypothetical protein
VATRLTKRGLSYYSSYFPDGWPDDQI